MKTTYEIKAKTDKDYEVAGLTKEENKRFWWQADLLCYYWFKLVNYSLVFIAFVRKLLFSFSSLRLAS